MAVTAPQNLDFETAGAGAGRALGWNFRSKASLSLAAGFVEGGADPSFVPLQSPNALDAGGDWALTHATITADAVAAPDTSITADKLQDDSTANPHFVASTHSRSFLAGHTYTFGAAFRHLDHAYAGPFISTGLGDAWAVLDVANGYVESVAPGNSNLIVNAETVDLPNGWTLIAISFTPKTTTTGTPQFNLFGDAAGTISFAGASESVYVWGGFIFDGDLEDAEAFEVGWSTNESYALALVIGTNALRGVWQEGVLIPANQETFEGAWNNTFWTDVVSGSDAVFDPGGANEPFENFEQAWSTTTWTDALPNPVATTFTPDIATFEEFEDGWDNVPYPLVILSPISATFDEPAGEVMEDFEEVVLETTCVPTIVAGVGVFVAANHTLLANQQVFIGADGGFPPTPLIKETAIYFVVAITTNTFGLALTSGGAALNITDIGTGTRIFVRGDPRLYWVSTNPTI